MPKASSADARVWSELVSASCEPGDPSAMLAAVKATAGRVIPCSAHRDQAAFVALQALARAYGEGLRDRRQRLSGCLISIAEECAAALGQPTTTRVAREPLSWKTQDLFDR